MGVLFGGFLWNRSSSSSTANCCKLNSRNLGIETIAECAVACTYGKGYIDLETRINELDASASPSLQHWWGHWICIEERTSSRSIDNISKYAGLRNQGCTWYMNSVHQKLFMIKDHGMMVDATLFGYFYCEKVGDTVLVQVMLWRLLRWK